MATSSDLAGSYIGRNKVREGRESELSPAERKKLVKDTAPISLELRADGTFTHKGATTGTFTQDGDLLQFQPLAFSGKTHEEMRAAAEEMGRVFGLGWLFSPFELRVVGSALESPDSGAVIVTEYLREEGR